MKQKAQILWLNECSANDVSLVGGKCASLGEMTRAGKNVPPGFAITVNTYQAFLEKTGIAQKIAQALAGMDLKAALSFAQATEIVYSIIKETVVPVEITDAIRSAYEQLCAKCGCENVLVAVRSSTTMEDSVETSFAGQHETYLNVSGWEDVLDNTLKCWASLFSGPAMHYRNIRSIQHNEAYMAVAVQKMVNAKAAGVMFTLDPVSGDRSKIVLEGAWGLGEGVVSGYVTPDHFGVKRGTFEVVEEWISPKLTEFVRDTQTGHTIERAVEEARQNISCLTNQELQQLAAIALSIEQHYGSPQDIEWALDKDLPFPENLVILQSRPITVWAGQQSQAAAQ